jgi:hypothetical protein
MVAVLGLPAAVPAQTSKAGVVTTIKGTAMVARASTPAPAPLKFRDDVFVQDRITTGEESILRILLGGKAVLTVRERSSVRITETATTSTIEVASGAMALAVNKDRMQPGEAVHVKTPNAVAAIRGTILITEVDAPADAPVTSHFTLLTGLIDVTPLDPTGRVSGPSMPMRPLQTVSVAGFTLPSMPRAISRGRASSVASEFRTGLNEPSKGANKGMVDDHVQKVTREAAALASEAAKKTASDDGPSQNGRGDRNGGRALTGGRLGGGGAAGDGLSVSSGGLTSSGGSSGGTSGGLSVSTGGLTVSTGGISGSGSGCTIGGDEIRLRDKIKLRRRD